MITTETIQIVPCGEVPYEIMKSIVYSVDTLFHQKAVIANKIPIPQFAYDINRKQYNASEILINYESLPEYINNKTILVLDVDLFIPIFTHVFGEARLGGNFALISIKRFKDTAFRNLVTERALKVALHELGHLYNLIHCNDSSCIMHFSGDIEDLDQISISLCNYCTQSLK